MRVRYDFFGHYVVYTTAMNGVAFQSMHNRSGMTNEEATRAFHREHAREIVVLQQQKRENENKSIKNDSGIIRSLA